MTDQNNTRQIIDVRLVQSLLESQFPRWKNLPIRPIKPGGWDNKTFRLGDDMLIRLPTAAHYAAQVEKEHYWLPKLAPPLPLAIPEPLTKGEPSEDYPWQWSIYRWLEGDVATTANINDLNNFAFNLAQFLAALQSIDSKNGPQPGQHNFYRGGYIKTYDAETRQAIAMLKDKIDPKAATAIWKTALDSTWAGPPVWVHGDISSGNLLVQDGRLTAVIDFGLMCVGDPACDLAIAWTFFEGESRATFQSTLKLDADTWARGRAWALWKALSYISSGKTDMNFEAQRAWLTIEQLTKEHNNI